MLVSILPMPSGTSTHLPDHRKSPVYWQNPKTVPCNAGTPATFAGTHLPVMHGWLGVHNAISPTAHDPVVVHAEDARAAMLSVPGQPGVALAGDKQHG